MLFPWARTVRRRARLSWNVSFRCDEFVSRNFTESIAIAFDCAACILHNWLKRYEGRVPVIALAGGRAPWQSWRSGRVAARSRRQTPWRHRDSAFAQSH
jgi:hypothetical protein